MDFRLQRTSERVQCPSSNTRFKVTKITIFTVDEFVPQSRGVPLKRDYYDSLSRSKEDWLLTESIGQIISLIILKTLSQTKTYDYK